MNSEAVDTGSVRIDELLDAGKWSPFQKFILGLLSLAYLTDGLANQSLGLAIPALVQDWGLPREAFASIAAIGLVGLTIGAVIGGMLGDRFGRRSTMIASTAVFGIATIAQAWASSPGELAAMRFVDGIGIGAMIPNGAALIAEFTPRPRRAFAIAFGMAFIPVGSMLAGLVGAMVIGPYGWQGLFVTLGGISLAVAVLLLFLLPESPTYLAISGGSQDRLRAIAARCGIRSGSAVIGAAEPRAGAEERTPLSALFDRDVASSTVFLWIAFFFCLLANYSMFSWVPAMLASLGFAVSLTGLGMTWLSLGGIIGGIGCGWLIGKCGSRVVVIAFAAGGVVSSFALGLLIDRGVGGLAGILGFLFVIGIFASGLLNGIYTFAAFIYPDRARSTGVGAAAAAGRLGAIVSSYAGVIALAVGGASGYFLLIAGSLAISLVAVASIKRQIPKAA